MNGYNKFLAALNIFLCLLIVATLYAISDLSSERDFMIKPHLKQNNPNYQNN